MTVIPYVEPEPFEDLSSDEDDVGYMSDERPMTTSDEEDGEDTIPLSPPASPDGNRLCHRFKEYLELVHGNISDISPSEMVKYLTEFCKDKIQNSEKLDVNKNQHIYKDAEIILANILDCFHEESNRLLLKYSSLDKYWKCPFRSKAVVVLSTITPPSSSA